MRKVGTGRDIIKYMTVERKGGVSIWKKKSGSNLKSCLGLTYGAGKEWILCDNLHITNVGNGKKGSPRSL